MHTFPLQEPAGLSWKGEGYEEQGEGKRLLADSALALFWEGVGRRPAGGATRELQVAASE